VDFQLSLESEGVGSAYPDQPLAATADDSVGNVMQLLRAQRTGSVLICEGEKLVGIVTERDALKAMAGGDEPHGFGARDYVEPARYGRKFRHSGQGDSHDVRGRLPPPADR